MLDSDLSFRVLDLNLLRVFDALMNESSVVGAATRLSITPSAVSHALGRLRVIFKDPLFVRSPGRMRATPRAAEIGPKVREGLRFLEGALTPTTFDAAQSNRTFSVACSAYVSAVLLPGVIGELRRRAPRAGISVSAWGHDTIARFAAGQIDVLIADFARVPEGCRVDMLFEDRLVWLKGRDYVLSDGSREESATRVRAVLSEIRARLPSRTVSESGFERRAMADEVCCMVGNSVDGTIEQPFLDSLPYALIAPLVVKHANLAALLPRRLAVLFAQEFGLDLIEPGSDVADRIGVAAVRHPEHGLRAPVAWFSDLLAEVAARPVSQEKERGENSRGRSRTLSPVEDEGHGEARLGNAGRR